MSVTSIDRRRPTRYTPTMSRDGSFELISAARKRQLDAEKLCERLSERFIGLIRLMSDDDIALLEVIAKGLFYTNDDDFYRLEPAIVRRFSKRSKGKQTDGTAK